MIYLVFIITNIYDEYSPTPYLDLVNLMMIISILFKI